MENVSGFPARWLSSQPPRSPQPEIGFFGKNLILIVQGKLGNHHYGLDVHFICYYFELHIKRGEAPMSFQCLCFSCSDGALGPSLRNKEGMGSAGLTRHFFPYSALPWPLFTFSVFSHVQVGTLLYTEPLINVACCGVVFFNDLLCDYWRDSYISWFHNQSWKGVERESCSSCFPPP